MRTLLKNTGASQLRNWVNRESLGWWDLTGRVCGQVCGRMSLGLRTITDV